MALKDFIERFGAGIVILVLTAALVFNLVSSHYYSVATAEKCTYCENLAKYGERMDLYDPANYKKAMVNGVYFEGKKYFCVWAANRSREDIQQTVCHEDLHYLIEDGDSYNHFCNRTNQKWN